MELVTKEEAKFWRFMSKMYNLDTSPIETADDIASDTFLTPATLIHLKNHQSDHKKSSKHNLKNSDSNHRRHKNLKKQKYWLVGHWLGEMFLELRKLYSLICKKP